MTESDLLGPLVKAIEAVKQRIQEYGPSLRENETRTRIALIDPILQALGWDVSDPASVTLEYDVQGRRADYALLKLEGRPAATIEAKKLGENLQQHRMQMLNYANASGIDYAGLTDGNHWELFDVFKRGELSERQLLDITISNSATHELALTLLRLWRRNLKSAEPVKAETPIVGIPAERQGEPLAMPTMIPVTEPSSSPLGKEWGTPLTEIRVETGKPGAPARPPSFVLFPDSQPRSISRWQEFLVATARWLVETNHISEDKLPIKAGIKRYVANSNRVDQDGGEPAPEGGYEKVSENPPIYIFHRENAPGVYRRLTALLKGCGVNPAEVRLSSDETGTPFEPSR